LSAPAVLVVPLDCRCLEWPRKKIWSGGDAAAGIVEIIEREGQGA
jgi:hypothetical protein